jgi:hypothetical protein
MTSRLHALQWQAALQPLAVVNQGSAMEGRGIHRVLYLRLFWEHPLQRCAVNALDVEYSKKMNGTCLFSLRERNIDHFRLRMTCTNG